MKLKFDVVHHFWTFVTYIQTQFFTKIQQLQSDGGGEI